jgi:hypothetical protein
MVWGVRYVGKAVLYVAEEHRETKREVGIVM